MKQKNLFKCALTACMLCISTAGEASNHYDFTATNRNGYTIYYSITSDSTCEVTSEQSYSNSSYTGSYSGKITIPKKASNGTITYKVTAIGKHAFDRCKGLTSVEIPNTVTSIGSRAFEGCTKLSSVEIPNSVTSIGDYAFEGCTGLTSVEIPNSVTSIGGNAFEGCTGLTSVVIPNSVTSIGWWAFYGCTGLTSVELPNTITAINSDTFRGCTGLKSVVIPNSVTSIGSMAFYGCTGLTSVEIPNSVTSIGDNAFDGCTKLSSLELSNSVTSIGERAFYDTNITSIVIPKSVTSIGKNALNKCQNIYFTSTSAPSLGNYGRKNVNYYVPISQKSDYKKEINNSSSSVIGYIPFASTTAPMTVKGVDDGYWGTIYTSAAVNVPEGVSVYVLSSLNDDKTKGFVTKVAEAGQIIPDGAYLIASATKKDSTIFLEGKSSNAVTISADNLLNGAVIDVKFEDDDVTFYMLTSNSTGDKYGFYRYSDDGHSISTLAYKAYLELENSASAKGITLVCDDNATGINSVNDDAVKSGKIYNLQGIEVSEPANGLYIKNGKKYIK